VLSSEDAACNRIDAVRTSRRFPVILDLLASGEVTLTNVRLLGRHLTSDHQAVLARAKGRSRPQIEVLVAELAPQPDVPTSASVASLSPAAFVRAVRPVIQPTAPERYRVQFSIGQETHDKLRRLQALLHREIPDGDPAAIFGRAVTLLLERVENKKFGATTKPRPRAIIRPETDRARSRETPRAVKREVSRQDSRCAVGGTTNTKLS
jgi:hypothetical protein